LANLRALSTAEARGLLYGQALDQSGSVGVLEALQALESSGLVLGGALYDAQGELVGTFGEPPTLDREPRHRDHYYRWQNRYDAPWDMDLLEDRYWLVIRHDASGVQREFFAFIGRITGLVIIISAFVTGTTLYVLRWLLIKPVLQLRQDLLTAGAAISEGTDALTLDFKTLDLVRDDELGDVITAFGQMLRQISHAITTRQQSEARFRTLVEQAVDAFFVVDQQGQIIDVNQTACHDLGYSRDELLRLTVPDIQKALTAADFEKIWQQLQPGLPQTQEGWHQRKDGTGFPVEVRLGLLETNQNHYILALARDITERKASEKTRARLAEIGELAAMIVHEVRSPLTTIMLGLTSFQTLALSERAQRRLSLALAEAHRLQQLLNEILMYSHGPILEREPIPLQMLMQEVATNVEAHLADSHKSLRLEPSQAGVTLWGDRNKLKQVFINLVSNAIEACPAGEAVTWQVHTSTPQQVTLSIHNGGEPIPPDILPKLTVPFFTTKPNGNGLGLAITKQIIDAHGGELTITSSGDQGTVVAVTLPLAGPGKERLAEV